jgi:polyphenol oxidase
MWMSEPMVKLDSSYYTIPEWTNVDSELVVGISTKQLPTNGNGNLAFHVTNDWKTVQVNRQQLANALSFPVQHWVGAEQTHESLIVKVQRKHRGRGALDYSTSFPHTDGFYTTEKGILLTLCFADCVPLYFRARNCPIIGVAHAGWKGTVRNIAGQMIDTFKKEGVSPADIEVVIGPSICSACYIVDDKVINLVKKTVEHGVENIYNEVKPGQYELDLKKVNKLLLIQAGVKREHIQTSSLCTSCKEEDFFSHRRDKGNAGRMLAFIGWKEDRSK